MKVTLVLFLDIYEENAFACSFFLKKISLDFKNPLPFRRLSAKPHPSKRLWGLVKPVIRQECRNFFHRIRITGEKHEG
ncbi:hypothetical protein COF64_06080 [Bacillus sp. AFS043905]|nr:hypothetical protein COF64_06080 [Bacillus sp. AFS043905]